MFSFDMHKFSKTTNHRSLESSVEIFAKALLERQLIAQIEFEILARMAEKLEPKCCKVTNNSTNKYFISNYIHCREIMNMSIFI